MIFIADNALVVECGDKSTIKLNSVVVEAAKGRVRRMVARKGRREEKNF